MYELDRIWNLAHMSKIVFEIGTEIKWLNVLNLWISNHTSVLNVFCFILFAGKEKHKD